MNTSDESEASPVYNDRNQCNTGATREGGKGVSIVLIDRRPVTRQCLSRWLQEGMPDLRVIPVGSPAELLKASRPLTAPQMIIFSIGAVSVKAPEVLGNLSLLRRHMSSIPLVLLGDRDDVDDIVAAVELGARAYIPTSLEVLEAAAAIRFVAAGGTFVPASAMIKFAHDWQDGSPDRRRHAGPVENLTPREAEVLALLRHGTRNKVIAHELSISESTVKVFVRRILRKMQASNRAELASLIYARTEVVGADRESRQAIPDATTPTQDRCLDEDRLDRISPPRSS